MNALILAGIVAGSITVILLLLTVINILQKGGPWRGGSAADILGREPESAGPEDLARLSKGRFVQLFYASPPPTMKELDGEFMAKNHPVGILGGAVEWYTSHLFGPGRWVGKAFRPLDGKRGEGYNIFEKAGADRPLRRTRRIDTFLGPSAFDGKESFHLLYRPYNGGVVRSMRDELRKVREGLYVGLGYMGLGGGSINPAPFIVYGKPDPWKGPDPD